MCELIKQCENWRELQADNVINLLLRCDTTLRMYAVKRIVLIKKSSRFRWKWSTCYVNIQSYHSENGVYGYKPSQRRHFEGIPLLKEKLKVTLDLFY